MTVYLTEEFISEVKLLLKKKSHSDCEVAIIESIYLKTKEEIISTGSPKRLGGNPSKSPFIRKRISPPSGSKSSGYRLYFWMMIEEDNVYLLFIHPKSGRRSGTNITPQKQKELADTFQQKRNDNSFIKSSINEATSKIIYTSNKNPIF